MHDTTQDVSNTVLLDIPTDALQSYCSSNGIRWLALFGSGLGPEFDHHSDIDLLVEFERNAKIGFLDLSRMQRELTALFGRTVDLVPRSGLKAAIRDDVLRSARTLYAA